VTIAKDLQTAIGAAAARGVGLAAMRLRMGLPALQALGAELAGGGFPYGDLPSSFAGIPIERVGSPGHGFTESTPDAFHGWELIA